MGRRTWAATRPLGGVLVLALIVWWTGPGPFVAGLRGPGPGALLAATAIGAVTTVCSAWRWRVVATALGVGLTLRAATSAYYRSQFLNSTLPGGVLGDVDRGLRHGADAGDLGRGLRAVGWERLAGQVVQAGTALVVLLALPSPARPAMPAVAVGGALVGMLLMVGGRGAVRRGPSRPAVALRAAAADARRALLRPGIRLPVLVTSLLVLGGHLALFLVAARSAGVTVAPRQLLPLALIVLLAAAVPLNVAGWGPREGAAAWAFAAAGPGAAAGAATATAFGLLTLVGVLPGAVLLLAGGLRRRRTLAHRPAPPREPVDRVPGRDREEAGVDG